MLLNKSHLIAIKNNKIILEGTRNPYDKLWDIPVKKQNISPQNYRMPAIHPTIYPPRLNSKPRSNINHAEKAHASIEIFREELSKFQEIIDHNLLDNLLKKQTKATNATEYCKANLDVKIHR